MIGVDCVRLTNLRYWGVVLLPAGLAACAATYRVAPGATVIAMRGDTTVAWGASDAARCVEDVPATLLRVPQFGTALGFHLAGAEGVGGYRRHWQGVQRLDVRDTTYMFVSRSGSSTAVLVVSLASRRAGSGPLGRSWVPTEGGGTGEPPAEDRVVAQIPFDTGYSHAGGLSLTGTVLAVPLDGEGRSQITFYDVSDPMRARRLGVVDHNDTPRPSTPTEASAVGLGRLADGRYLMVLGVHSSKILEF